MVLDRATRYALNCKSSGATKQCVAAARAENAWEGDGNGGARWLPLAKKGAKGVELITELAKLVQAGFMTEDQARAMLDKHGI